MDHSLPPASRIPAMVGLVAIGLYLCGGFWFSLSTFSVVPASPVTSLFSLGHWHMFTESRPLHHDLDVALYRDGVWATGDLAALFPERGTAGPGYLRRAYWADPERMATLAAAVCARQPAERVRFSRVQWPKTLGASTQPQRDGQRTALVDMACPQ